MTKLDVYRDEHCQIRCKLFAIWYVHPDKQCQEHRTIFIFYFFIYFYYFYKVYGIHIILNQFYMFFIIFRGYGHWITYIILERTFYRNSVFQLDDSVAILVSLKLF